jgi:hypothetical protein
MQSFPMTAKSLVRIGKTHRSLVLALSSQKRPSSFSGIASDWRNLRLKKIHTFVGEEGSTALVPALPGFQALKTPFRPAVSIVCYGDFMNNVIQFFKGLRYGPAVTLILAASAYMAQGCTSKDKSNQAVINGSVEYKNKPVTGGKLSFYPADGGPEFPVVINANGKFKALNLSIGKMTVTVETEYLKNVRQLGQPAMDTSKIPANMKDKIKNLDIAGLGESGSPLVYVKIPSKYAKKNSTDIEIMVYEENPEEFVIKLID